jgi:hypothetical protein
MTTLVRPQLHGQPRDRSHLLQRILEPGGTAAIGEVVRSVALQIQDELYARDLPIGRWREVASAVDSQAVLTDLAREIELGFEVSSSRVEEKGRWVVWLASTLGGLVPAGFVLVGLGVMTRDLYLGNYAGLTLLWHLVAMVILFFLVLQGFIGAVLPGRERGIRPEPGSQAVRRVLNRVVEGWLRTYRTELEADLADLREPVEVLRNAVNLETAGTDPRLNGAEGRLANPSLESLS